MIIELENLVTKILSIFFFSKILNSDESFNFDFNKVKSNIVEKGDLIKLEGRKIYKLFKQVNFYKEIRNKDKIDKFYRLLNDKDLIKNLYKAVIFNYPRLQTKKRKRKTIKSIFKLIKVGKINTLLSFVVRKLIRRRRYLWKHINIIIYRAPFILIGKDYKIYKQKIATTYISQTNKYSINYTKKKKVNAKYIKCVELLLSRSFRIEFNRFFKNILYINKILYYLFNRFYSLLFQYSQKLYDKYFAIPYKGKNRSFNEIMSRFLSVTQKGKEELMLSILLVQKHKLEKRILKSLQSKRDLPIEAFVNLMEREKYYPKHRRTKLPLKAYKWLMKHVYDDMALEEKEYNSRPRVIIEKREEIVESTYPYLPRDPLKFQRDVSNEQFKRTKPLKYRIIRLTKPKVALQPKFFNFYKSGGFISKNLLRTKLNSKKNIPQRVQRILVFCEIVYKNLLKSYKNFFNLIKKFKILYLYNENLKYKISSFIGFCLSLIVSPIFCRISEEREYAHQLKVFLNNYLIRLRLFKRFDLANSFCEVNKGYIFPKKKNLAFYKRLVANVPKIMRRKPNYIFMRYMYKRSFKRLTIRIRSKAVAIYGIRPLYKYNLMATDYCSPMNLKKRFMGKGNFYLTQPNVNFKAKAKHKLYFSALKRSFGYSAAYHINARLYYFSPYNLFLKKVNDDILPEEDSITKYQTYSYQR